MTKKLAFHLSSVLVSTDYPFFLSCGNLSRSENQTTVPNPPTSSKLLRFYLMSKVCPNSFAVAYPCECGKVYSGETGRPMQDKIKEHDRDNRLARTETAAVSEHAHNTGHKPLWNEIKFIDRDPYYYMRRVKEAIDVRLHPDNINRDSGIEIPEAWMPTIKKHNNRRSVGQRTAEGVNH